METQQIQKRSFYGELRKHERTPTKEGAVAAFVTKDKQYFTNVGQIVDISIGGLGIKYTSKNGGFHKDESVLIEILGNERPVSTLGIVQCRVAYDMPLEKDSWSNLTTRRCGLEFVGLLWEQTNKLRRFMRIYSKN